MTLTELSIKRPSFVIVIFSALALLALFGYSMLKYELLPNISIPWVVVSTVYPGASPNEVENSVTKPMEDALSGLEKVERIISSSYEGVSVISIEFNKSADVESSLQEAQRRVNQISLTLPKGIRTPIFQKISLAETHKSSKETPSNMAVYRFTPSSPLRLTSSKIEVTVFSTASMVCVGLFNRVSQSFFGGFIIFFIVFKIV